MSLKRLVSLNTVSLDTDPSNPRIGDIYLNSVSNKVRVFTNNGWIEVGAGSGSAGSAVHIGTTPPETATEGDLWYNNVDPHFYTYDGTYWVEISFGPVGPVGPGLAAGGITGQIASKASNTDYDVTWVNPYTSNTFNTDFASKSSTDLAEGSKLFFTNERAQDAIGNYLGTGLSYDDASGAISIDSTIANKTYVDNAVSSLSSTASTTYIPVSDLGNPDGVATLDSSGYIPVSQLGNIIDGAPAVLDTLKEIATAIGNDPSFTTDVYSSINGVQSNLNTLGGTVTTLTSTVNDIQASVYDTEIGIIMGAY